MARDTYETKDEMDQPEARDGLGNALVILTTIVLVIAFFTMQKAMATKFNEGMLADKQASPR